MNVFDTHCDLLSKMYVHPEIRFDEETPFNAVSYPRLRAGHVAAQLFAVYLSEKIDLLTFEPILKMIDLFERYVLSHPEVAAIRTGADLEQAATEGKLGAILTLEGAEGLEGSFVYLRTAFRLGVRCIGITWNRANWAADGVGEPRGGGFTVKGRQFVKECDQLGILLDVSHLTEKGFWELTELTDLPFFASHSNAYAICPHRRNLKDDQIEAIVQRNGFIGLTFVPYFVKPSGTRIADLLHHIDHISGLGGESVIGFGSDFDGVEQWIPGLEHPGKYGNLADVLVKHYKEEQVRNFLFGNAYRYFRENLPKV